MAIKAPAAKSWMPSRKVLVQWLTTILAMVLSYSVAQTWVTPVEALTISSVVAPNLGLLAGYMMKEAARL